jgi:hypothetical protein
MDVSGDELLVLELSIPSRNPIQQGARERQHKEPVIRGDGMKPRKMTQVPDK